MNSLKFIKMNDVQRAAVDRDMKIDASDYEQWEFIVDKASNYHNEWENNLFWDYHLF